MSMPPSPNIKFIPKPSGNGGGGLDIHHRGSGGGTRNPINDLPLFDFEDHDVFNTSFGWAFTDYNYYNFDYGIDWKFKYWPNGYTHIINPLTGGLGLLTGLGPSDLVVYYRNLLLYLMGYGEQEEHVMIKGFTMEYTETAGFVFGFGSILGAFDDEFNNSNYGAFITNIGGTNFKGYINNGIGSAFIDLNVPLQSGTQVKLHVYLTDTFVKFYINDIECGEMTLADYPDYYPLGITLIPQLGIREYSEESYNLFYEITLPMVHASKLLGGPS